MVGSHGKTIYRKLKSGSRRGGAETQTTRLRVILHLAHHPLHRFK
jgi:hypothetical protein